MIYVTKPFIPAIEEYQKYLSGIWKREYLTNDGPLVRELESKLKNYLGVDQISYVSNGTIALQFAIKALDITSEIITTPFSYVATTSSIVWENCTPIFADINPETFNIDPNQIESLVTDKTTAIIATHVFGNPCEIQAIQNIADRYNLKVIYDAAHCFGSKYNNQSIFGFGDISTASFHATKLFHTVEGGAVFTSNKELQSRINYLRNFGHDGPGKFNGVGINGKNSELHAAMGHAVLNHIDSILLQRKVQSEFYTESLADLNVQFQLINNNVADFNYAYFPIVFESETILLKVINVLEGKNIFPRRYFYPSLTKLEYVIGTCPISDDISSRILCLPLYHDLTKEEQELVVDSIRSVID